MLPTRFALLALCVSLVTPAQAIDSQPVIRELIADCRAIETNCEPLIRIQMDRQTLLDLAAYEPNLAIALHFLIHAGGAIGVETSTGQIVVPAYTAAQARAAINGETVAARSQPWARFRVQFMQGADHFTLRLLPLDARSIGGARLRLDPADDGSYRIAGWHPY